MGKRSYELAFKVRAVELAEQIGNRPAAAGLGVDEKQIREWRLQSASGKFSLMSMSLGDGTAAKRKRLFGGGRRPFGIQAQEFLSIEHDIFDDTGMESGDVINGHSSQQESHETPTSKESAWTLNDPLSEADPEVYGLIRLEKDRQRKGLEMIASENFTSVAVLDCLSSCLHNKYSEGLPHARYYGGNEIVDKIEILAQKRSLQAFGLSPEEWGVNVQPYSGSPANFAVYTGIVEPHGRIMGLDLPDGGHLTHGFFTAKKKVSATSIFFESMPYKVNPATGLIDYDELERTSKLFRPKLIIAGVSCYTRNLDYARFRKIANDCGAILMADMAHIAGLVAAGVIPSPFPHCDIVTSTVHKTLRGPRSGVIFFRKGSNGQSTAYDFEEKINTAVFPGLQGGPHNMAIAAIAVAMKHAQSEEFSLYQSNVVKNARALAEELTKLGYRIVTGGTDNHIVLVDLSTVKLSGAKAERILELVDISVNKNTVPGDKSAMNPSGIRIGLPPLTTRGVLTHHIPTVVDFMHRAFNIAIEVQKVSGPKLVDWRREVESNPEFSKSVSELKAEVETFAVQFPLPGRDDI